jgi:hypothetical protein
LWGKGMWACCDPGWSNECNLWANSILSIEVRSKLLAPLKLWLMIKTLNRIIGTCGTKLVLWD